MSLLNNLKKRYLRLTEVKFDKSTGFYKYNRFSKNIYIRHPKHFLEEKDHVWLCKKIFFKYYMPHNDDFVLDLGAGYGEEACFLHAKSPSTRYLGVEGQPVIYECLSNTFHEIGKNYQTSPYVISSSPIKFRSQFSYASVTGSEQESYIEIPTLSWNEFLKKYHIHKIDLFKMNIEGAEKQILDSISDFSFIKRFIISCHDFRANCGEGEHFRTKKHVLHILEKNNYQIKTFDYKISWADDWIYAEKN